MRILLLLILIAFVPLLCTSQLLSNYDTCRTQLYYQYVGNTAKETHIEKARTVQDNGIINAGYSKQASGQDALIIKQNTFGEVIWQKEYGDVAYDEKFTDWRELTNKQLLVGGIAKNRVTLQSVFFMMLLSENGDIIWQRSYADIAASSNINNVKIYPDFYGEHFFAAQTDSSIIYGMVNGTNGVLNWNRSFNSNPSTTLVGVTSNYSRLLIATNALDSGYHVSNFYYINYYWVGSPKNILYTTKLGGAHQNSNYILHDIEEYSQYTYFSGIKSINNAPYELTRINMNQGSIPEALETIITPGLIIDSTARSAISIYGDGISFTESRKNDRVHTIKMTGSENYPTYTIWSSTYQLPDSIVMGGNIKTWDDGYIFFGFKELPGGNKKIIQLKLDSASLAPTCINRRAENFTVIRTSFPTDTVSYVYNNLHGLANFNYLALVNDAVIDTLTLCRELKCPEIPVSDSCLNSYQKLYQAYEPGTFTTGIEIINSRTFISGIVYSMDYIPENQNSFIAEVNGNGQVVNQKKYVIGFGSYSKIFKGKDSSLLLYGSTSDSSYYRSVFLAKIDTLLNVIWMRSLRLTTTPQYASNLTVSEVKQGSDGSYFIQYSDRVDFGETRIYLTKLDVNGDFLWSKIYRAGDPGHANIIAGTRMEIFGGNVYITCVNAYNSYSATFLLKLTENDGNLLWCKKYSNAGDYLSLSSLTHMYNNELYFGGLFRYNSTDSYQNILLKAGTDGSILNSVSLKNIATNVSPPMQFMQHNNGNIYMASVFYDTPPFSNPNQVNVTVNSSLNLIASKKRPTTLYSLGKYLAMGGDQQLRETGVRITGEDFQGRLYVSKFALDGNLGTCPSDTMLLQSLTPSAITITDISCAQSDSFFNIRTPVYHADQFFLATSKLLCASVPGCNYLDITGSDSICDKTQQYTFRAVRNNGCSAPLQWYYDHSNVQLLNETDSLITFRFLNPGDFLLKARFTSNCTPYSDSLLIHIIGDAPILELGADTSLCPGATLLLNAKKGFRSYLWQDGSSDSTFTVTAGGLYYVAVTDSCNNIFRDSIRVLINGNVPILNLGPDSNFCNTNTILLNAHKGFLSYQWQDGSTDSLFTATTPGQYYVTVTDACGNSFSDTVKIYSYRRATSLNLGADTIFCNQVVMPLNAGTGFQSYLWQDGSINPIFTAQNTGLYYVQVTDSCGSVFTDSIRIFPDNIIAFDIGPDTSICKTDSLLLQVTPGLNNYTWWPQINIVPQGPAAITVFPFTSTWYHVSAVKQNGCMVTDSILIDVHIPPSIYLGPDINICTGDSLQLNAGPGFNNYTWSTGEHTASIQAHDALQYYVSATDNNNCISRDTLSILSIIPLPVTKLPAETGICLGQPLTLNAGTGFTTYSWNTGASTENIVVSSMGQYWVTVTNSFGCRNTDSVLVNKQLSSPSDFIKDKDSTICSFETITLTSSQTYTSYLWNTGSTASSITVNSAGNYWLKVTDINGCIGTDSFTLAIKDCNIGVFFPNSFTPNNDGWNDTYKPRAYGRLNSYHISIYNRYGERLFDSRDINEGWNGEFKGVKQEAGAFVWQCSYQLGGTAIQNKSGSLLLIR